MKYLSSCAIGLLVFWGLSQASRACDDPYLDLLRQLPDGTNVVVTADVQGLGKTLGLAPGTTLQTAGITSLPVMASRFVMGAHVDLSLRRHIWSVALAELDSKMSIQDVATAENEPIEKFMGYSIVPSSRNGYFVEFEPHFLAARTPANRQELKRWLHNRKSNQFAERPLYLLQALDPATPALMMMVVDLTDSLDPGAILRGLNNSQVMESRKNPNYAGVAKTLEALQGVTLAIRPGNPLSGELLVNFNTKIDPISNFAKELLLEALQKTGLYVRDFEAWDPYIADRFVRLKGTLSLQALRRFGTLIKTPAPNPTVVDMDAYKSRSPVERGLVSSQLYFKSVSKFLKDLKAESSGDDKTLAGWYEQYADQIDKLPVLDVAPELLSYASATSQNLRAMSAALTGVSLQRSYLQKEKQNLVGDSYSYTPYYGWQGVPQQIAAQQDALVAQGGADRAQLWARIDSDTADIRRQMSLKFGNEF
jgi:hypothetical protein